MTTSGAGLADRAAEHHVDCGLRLGGRLRDDHTLAGGKPVSLDHDRRAMRAHVDLGRIGGAEAFIGRRGDIVGATQILGEALGAFEPRRGACRAECLDAGGFQVIDDAGAERAFRPDHDKFDPVGAAVRDDGAMVGDIERDAFGVLRDAGIAGCANRVAQ